MMKKGKAAAIKRQMERYGEYEAYGIRFDMNHYAPHSIARKSHRLYQDPVFGEDGELAYPLNDSGFYDAGELAGTCAVRIGSDADLDGIEKAMDKLEEMYAYASGGYIHLIGGDSWEWGGQPGDPDEIIIRDAVVLAEVAH